MLHYESLIRGHWWMYRVENMISTFITVCGNECMIIVTIYWEDTFNK